MFTSIGVDLTRPVNPMGGWTPAALANQLLWLDASQGITEDVDGVASWVDQFNGHEFTQSTGAAKPDLVTLVDGQPAVSFDGVDDVLSLATDTVDFNPGGDYALTVWAVFQAPVNNNLRWVLGSNYSAMMVDVNHAEAMRIGNSPLSAADVYDDPNPQILEWAVRPVGTPPAKQVHFFAGKVDYTPIQAEPWWTQSYLNPYWHRLGASSADATGNSIMKLAELIVVTEFHENGTEGASTADREAAYSYLANKYPTLETW